jgi:hypothetical protein
MLRVSLKCHAAVDCGLAVPWDGLSPLRMIISGFFPQLCWRLGSTVAVSEFVYWTTLSNAQLFMCACTQA